MIMLIRQANEKDLSRISEIEIVNYRQNFYPIFRDNWYYFSFLTVENKINEYKDLFDNVEQLINR